MKPKPLPSCRRTSLMRWTVHGHGLMGLGAGGGTFLCMETGSTSATSSDRRQLVTIETVTGVQPIPDADAIEVVTVRGWQVVTKIGEVSVGERCVYFEIDSLLPLDDPRFSFLAPRGTKEVDGRMCHRLKTARLRGVYSQGLVLAAADFPELGSGGDLAERLGVLKYEPPAVLAGGDIIGTFPEHLGQRTDSERAQNLAGVWDAIVAGGPWLGTEKLDGTSMSVFRDRDGVLHVCGRNYEIGDGDNLYWNAMRAHRIDTWLEQGCGVQCEVYGEGIQKNPLGVKGVRVGIFAFLVGREPVARDRWPGEALAHAVPVLDLILPGSAEEAVAQAEHIDSVVSPGRAAEGMVWHQADGRALAELGHRATFKVVSNRYLLKHDG